MEKYAVLSAVNRGTFWERLCHLYMKTGDYVDMENLENRNIVYVKVFLSDIKNQYAALQESQLWLDYLSHVPCSVIGQAPLDGSKISLLVCTSDTRPLYSFCQMRLSGDDVADKDVYGQAVALFEKFIDKCQLSDITCKPAGIRMWVYVSDIEDCFHAVNKARIDVFERYGITADSHCMAVTAVEGTAYENKAQVALDYMSFGGDGVSVVPLNADSAVAEDITAYGSCSGDMGVSVGQDLRVDILPFVLSSCSDAKISQPDVRHYAGQILGEFGIRLKRYGLTMNHVSCFVTYLRDFSDYADVDRLLSMAFPYVPHAIVEAKGLCGHIPVMIECVAARREQPE